MGRIETCLEMIKFRIGNTLFMFIHKYYEYGGKEDVEEREGCWRIQIGMACQIHYIVPAGVCK